MFEINLKSDKKDSKPLKKALKGVYDYLTNRVKGRIVNNTDTGEILKSRQNAFRTSGIFKICIEHLEIL